MATMWRGTVDMEDKLRVASWSKNGGVTATVAKALEPPPRPLPRNEMLNFATAFKGTADWKSALADPAAAEAMRRVRARVAELNAEGHAINTFSRVQPNAGATLLNKKEPAPRHVQFRTSTLNPMNADAVERGWDPRIRMWTGRRIDGKPPDPTSLWCSSWGASAGEKALDTEFKVVRPQDIEPYHQERIKELGHTRGWR